MNLSLTQCPYDGNVLDSELSPGGLLFLVCHGCDAAWEIHGSHVERVRVPDRDRVIAARTGAPAQDAALYRKGRRALHADRSGSAAER